MVNESLKRIIIASVSNNGIIGNRNQIPWHSVEELKHFRITTTGFPVILGRITFSSIGKTLPNRLNIVISKKRENTNRKENLVYFNSLKKAYNYLRKNNFQKVFICGGARIYRNAIKHSEEMLISKMKLDAEGDSLFPAINMKIWKLNEEKDFNEFTLQHFVRR